MINPARSPATAVVLAAAAALLTGCGGYGPVSPAAYDLAKGVYSVTSRESAERLDVLASKIDEAAGAGQLTGDEQLWLRDMVATARNGDWAAARDAARTMMEDQIDDANRH